MNYLEKYLYRNGIKKSAFARKIPISPNFFSSILHKKVPLSKIVALRIENLTKGEVSADQLLTIEEE